jgi:hypothetical protein
LFADTSGKVGNSNIQSDAVNSVVMDTYPDAPPNVTKGNVVAYQNARSADDGGAQVQFIETATIYND